MSTLILTLMIAFILVVLAIAALSVGWLFSGKSKIVRSASGSDPNKLREKECGTDTKCGMCETEIDKKPKTKEANKKNKNVK